MSYAHRNPTIRCATCMLKANIKAKIEQNRSIGMSDDGILSLHVDIIPTQRIYIITNINMVRSIDPAKFKKLVKVVRLAPHLCIPDAMKLAKYSDDEVADLSFRRLLQRRLRGGSLDSFRAIVRAKAAPRPNRDERHKTRQPRAERTPPPKRTPPFHSSTTHCA